ncbi:MAG: hypothetical protein F9K28_05370 [Bacteroidetes bacterium]|nr:MAG: hypothetical protein F9K28_05370 [Bacteroidota bacterium]MBZ0195541.1 hypothetical protein [Candidatus Kapabacteria bacterium]
MTTKIFIITAYLVLTVSGIHASAETGRMKTLFVNFPPTFINEVETKTVVFEGLADGASFEPELYNPAPFRITSPTDSLFVRNGKLTIQSTFEPTTVGKFTKDVLLFSSSVLSDDTIRLRFNGYGYMATRTVVLDFGTMEPGSAAYRSVPVMANLPTDEKWSQVEPPSAPFVSLGDTLTLNGTTLEYRFLFKPVVTGRYTDTTRIVRYKDNIALETISVVMLGSAQYQVAELLSTIAPVLTGDTAFVQRTHTPRVPLSVYKVLQSPDLPFTVLLTGNNQPFTDKNSNIILAAGFKPVAAGTYADTLVLARLNSQGDATDTIRWIIKATAEQQTPEAALVFDDVVAGRPETKTMSVILPIKPRQTFGYQIIPDESAPVVAEIESISSTDIVVKFTVSPTTYQPLLVREFKLYRSVNMRYADSTLIKVKVFMKPRPVSVMVWIDTVQSRIGDTTAFIVRATASQPLDIPFELPGLSISVSYNPTLFVVLPESNQSMKRESGTIRAIIPTANAVLMSPDSAVEIGRINGVVTMGDSDSSILAVRFEADPLGSTTVASWNLSSGLLLVSNVWKYNGKARYVNTLQDSLDISVQPNPVLTTGTIRIINVPNNGVTMYIANPAGKVVANLTSDVSNGIREWVVGSAPGNLLLQRGEYYIRLVVTSESGLELYGVTRLIAIQ